VTGTSTGVKRKQVPYASMEFGDLTSELSPRGNVTLLPDPDKREL
jgi:hypothetical protein